VLDCPRYRSRLPHGSGTVLPVLVIASGCVAWVIIIATDQPASHKAAVTQKVVPHKVGRGAPTD